MNLWSLWGTDHTKFAAITKFGVGSVFIYDCRNLATTQKSDEYKKIWRAFSIFDDCVVSIENPMCLLNSSNRSAIAKIWRSYKNLATVKKYGDSTNLTTTHKSDDPVLAIALNFKEKNGCAIIFLQNRRSQKSATTKIGDHKNRRPQKSAITENSDWSYFSHYMALKKRLMSLLYIFNKTVSWHDYRTESGPHLITFRILVASLNSTWRVWIHRTRLPKCVW